MPQRGPVRQFVACVLAGMGGETQGCAMIPRSPLDDPRIAAFAWKRFRRLMRLMVGVTLAIVIGAVALLYHENGLVSIHLYIATALGIGIAMLLMSALMGLVFLSHGTGHDDAVVDPTPDEWKDKPD
jgi:hypothetical protein